MPPKRKMKKTTKSSFVSLPRRTNDAATIKNILIGCLLEQRRTLMGDFLQGKSEEEIENACEEAHTIGLNAFTGEHTQTKRQLEATLRHRVILLYGRTHFKMEANNFATFSEQFFEAFWRYKDMPELKQLAKKQSQSSSSEEEDEKSKNPKEDESDEDDEGDQSESLLSGGDDDSDSPPTTFLNYMKTKSTVALKKFQATPVTPIAATTRAKKQTQQEQEEDTPTIANVKRTKPDNDDVLLMGEEDIDEFEKKLLEMPSPKMTPEEPEAQVPIDPPFPLTQQNSEITKQIEQIRHRQGQHSQRFETQGEKFESQFNMLLARIDTQDRKIKELEKFEKEIKIQDEQIKELEKFEKDIKIQDERILELEEEIAQLQHNAALSQTKAKTSEVLEWAKTELEEFEERGSKFVTNLFEKSQVYVEKCNKAKDELARTITDTQHIGKRIQQEAKAIVNTQMRAFETRIDKSITFKTNEATAALNATSTRKQQQLDNSGISILTACERFMEDINNAAIQKVDAASAEFELARKETTKRFHKKFETELLDIYRKERLTFLTALDTTLENAIKQQENRITTFATTEANKILDDASFSTTINTALKEQMTQAQAQLSSVRDEMKEETSTLQEQLSNHVTNLKKELTLAKNSHHKETEEKITQAIKSFEEMVAIEKGGVENRQAAAANRHQETSQPKSSDQHCDSNSSKTTPTVDSDPDGPDTAQSTLGNTAFDYRSTAGAMDPEDPGGDDSSSNDEDDDEKSDPNAEREEKKKKKKKKKKEETFELPRDAIGRPRRPRHLMFKVADYRKNLRRFAKDTLIIQECDRGPLTETSAEDLYRAFHRQMYELSIPLIPYDKLRPNDACIHPEDIEILNELDPDLLTATKDAILVKLTSVIDETDKQAKEVLDIHNHSRDGYKALCALIERFTRKLDVIPDMWSTEWRQTQSVFEFVGEMVRCRKRSHEKAGRNRRYYTEEEMKMELILRSRTLPQFQILSTLLLFLLDCTGAEVLANYSFTKLSRFYETIDQQHKRVVDGDMSTITDSVLHKIEAEQLVVNKFNKKRGARSDVQCDICKQYGHSVKTDHICYFAGKLYYSLHDLGLLQAPFLDKTRLKAHEENATKYNTYNYPPNIKKFITDNNLDSMEVDDVNVLLAHKLHMEQPLEPPPKHFG